MVGVLSRIGRCIVDIFLKLLYRDKKLFLIVISALILFPIAGILNYQDELSHSKYNNAIIPFTVWVLLVGGVLYKPKKSRHHKGISQSPSRSSNASSRYKETIRNLKNNQREEKKKQQKEIKQLNSNLTKLDDKITRILPKENRAEKDQYSPMPGINWKVKDGLYNTISEIDLQDDFKRFEWRDMELLTGFLFEKKGYSVEVTKPTGDFGIDVKAKSSKEFLGIQVKHQQADIGFEVVAKTLGVAQKFNKVIIVSTKAGFTSQALEHAKNNTYLIELWDANRFKKELRENLIK